ncbi:994_t:CDS:2, partial [Acaulospora colombiana]
MGWPTSESCARVGTKAARSTETRLSTPSYDTDTLAARERRIDTNASQIERFVKVREIETWLLPPAHRQRTKYQAVLDRYSTLTPSPSDLPDANAEPHQMEDEQTSREKRDPSATPPLSPPKHDFPALMDIPYHLQRCFPPRPICLSQSVLPSTPPTAQLFPVCQINPKLKQHAIFELTGRFSGFEDATQPLDSPRTSKSHDASDKWAGTERNCN